MIEDENSKRKMIVQIYDEEYLSSQSLIEDIVKDEIVTASSMENLHDPLNIGSLSKMIRDARLFHTKIRATIDSSNKLSSDVTWLPSRVYSKIRRLKISELCSFLGRTGIFPISIGDAGTENEEFEIYAEDLDGRLNIITGKKESGKSHLSKMLVKTLVQHGAFVIVFDLNNEYGGLAWNHDGTPSSIKDQIMILEPGNGLKFSLDYCGKTAMSSMLRNALDTPAASLREFFRIWDSLENKQTTLRIEALGNAINTWNINELIRDALISRYHVIHSSRLFSNNSDGDDLRFESVIERNRKGVAMIVNMGKSSTCCKKNDCRTNID
ncbi:MAG TPA: DUF87 domain-containing protein [Nitrososphaeraceae archaeon]|nr:DUF87 domain-containing protein [Nitrososphaeraceae archaeon]